MLAAAVWTAVIPIALFLLFQPLLHHLTRER
jgi:hypothetical protein